MRIGSRAAATREPRQVRKEAALSADRRVPRTGLVRADRLAGPSSVLGRRRVHGDPTRASWRPMAEPPNATGQHHVAIYRRFRAQTFAQIVGQSSLVETLRNAVRLGRLGHGFLFVGPRGTGKTSMARILAKAVNCTDLRDGEPCDACPSCVAIREGRALDVIELDAASNNKVDDMRDLLPRVYTAASDLRHKVFIIDEVQRIKEGWDVLLKTLEEPPQGVLFIFCTTDPSQIRPAVVSRLQRFVFRPLPRADIESKLQRILEAEGRVVEPAALSLIAELAAGGMRDAESLLDQVLGSAVDPITADGVRDLLGHAEAGAVGGFVDALVSGDALAGIAVLDALEAEGRDVVAFGDQVVGLLRRRLVESLTGGDARRSDAARLARIARRLTGMDSGRAGPGGQRWQLELCLLTAAADQGDGSPAPPPAPPPGPAARADASAATRTPAHTHESVPPAAGPDTPAPQAPPIGVPAPEGGSAIDILRQGWPRVVAHVGRNPANRPIIAACRPVEVRDGVLLLGFPEDQAFMRDIAERKRAVLEDGIATVLGRPMGIRCVVTNLELVEPTHVAGPDLVAQARRIFGEELTGIEDIG